VGIILKKNELRHTRTQIVQTSIYSVAMGIGLEYLNLGLNLTPFTALLKFIGGLGIMYYAFTWSRFDVIFKNLDLHVGLAYPIIKGKKKTEYSTIYKFTLPAGLSLKDFEDKKEAIEQHLGREIDIKYTYREIQIEVFKENKKTHYDYEPVKIHGDVPVIIGYDKRGNLITCDLASDEPHMLIAGETGSGKSTILRDIITNFILMSKVKLHLIDLKMGAEFNIFAKSDKVISFSRTIYEAKNTLYQITKEIERRYDLFFRHDVKDIKDYNKKFKSNKLSYEVLIIDEFAELQYDKESMEALDMLGRMARACGIHMILATQRPDHKVLTGNIKVNVGTVLGLKTLNEINSKIIIDDNGLEKLRGRGHGLFKRGGDIIEIQAPYLPTEKTIELIKHTYVDKPKLHIIDNGDLSDDDLNNIVSNW